MTHFIKSPFLRAFQLQKVKLSTLLQEYRACIQTLKKPDAFAPASALLTSVLSLCSKTWSDHTFTEGLTLRTSAKVIISRAARADGCWLKKTHTLSFSPAAPKCITQGSHATIFKPAAEQLHGNATLCKHQSLMRNRQPAGQPGPVRTHVRRLTAPRPGGDARCRCSNNRRGRGLTPLQVRRRRNVHRQTCGVIWPSPNRNYHRWDVTGGGADGTKQPSQQSWGGGAAVLLGCAAGMTESRRRGGWGSLSASAAQHPHIGHPFHVQWFIRQHWSGKTHLFWTITKKKKNFLWMKEWGHQMYA